MLFFRLLSFAALRLLLGCLLLSAKAFGFRFSTGLRLLARPRRRFALLSVFGFCSCSLFDFRSSCLLSLEARARF